MDLGLRVLEQTIVLLLLMIAGVVCYKAKLVDEDTLPKLTNIALYVANPFLVLMSYQTELDKNVLVGMGVTAITAIIAFAVSIALSYLLIRNSAKRDHMVERHSLIFSNCGFMGLPLISGIFGAEGVVYLSAYLTVNNILVWSYGWITMQGQGAKGILKKIVLNPVIIALVVGLVLMLAKIRIPGIPANAFTYLSNLNTPLVMIIAGITIATTDIGAAFRKGKLYLILVMRLLVLPLLVFAICRPLFGTQIPMLVTVIITGCPVGAIVTMFAIKFGRDSKYASEIFAISSLASCATLPLLALLIT